MSISSIDWSKCTDMTGRIDLHALAMSSIVNYDELPVAMKFKVVRSIAFMEKITPIYSREVAALFIFNLIYMMNTPVEGLH